MNSSITVNDRETAIITGVKSVESMTDTEISVFTEKGDLLICGESLQPDEFDPHSGVFTVHGRIDRLSWLTEKHHLPDNLISRLFR